MSVSKPTHDSHPADRPKRGTSTRRRTALELARIYVSSSAHTAALEVLDGMPSNGWDEEARLLRAECYIGLGRMLHANQLLGPLTIPGSSSKRESSSVGTNGRRRSAKRLASTEGEPAGGPVGPPKEDSPSPDPRGSEEARGADGLGTIQDSEETRILLPRFATSSTRPRQQSRRERIALWRFLLQLRVMHRTGRYRDVLQVGRAFFGEQTYGPSLLLARIATVMAQSMMTLQRPAEARDIYEQVVEIYRGFRSREGIADTLLGIANTHLLDCHWDEADAVYQECRYRYEELGHTSKALACLINLGVLRVKRGDFVSGRSLLLQGMARANQAGEARRLVTIHLGLAMADMRTGSLGSARRSLLQAVQFARRAQNRRGISLALEFLGEMHLSTGHTNRARRCLELGLAQARKRGGDADIAFEIQRRLAQVALAEGRITDARTQAARAQAGAQAFGDAYESATVDRVRAEIEETAGNLPLALQLARRAASVLDYLGETHERALVEVVTLRLEHRLGRRTHQALRDRLGEIVRLHEKSPESPVLRAAKALEGCVSQHLPTFQLTEPPLREDVSGPGGSRSERSHPGQLTEKEAALAHSFGLVSQSRQFLAMLSLARQISPHSTPVLVLGEPGSGRSLVARLIHAWSNRPGIYAPFHCSPLPGDVLSAELFGAGTSARSGLLAAGCQGTVYLDDIVQLPLTVQAELLEWLERRETQHGDEDTARVISAAQTHALRLSVRFGGAAASLREDLYNRLARVILEVPPLRDRLEDVPGLTRLFLEQGAHRLGIPTPELPAHVMDQFHHRVWPGNLVELRQEIELILLRHRRERAGSSSESPAPRSRPEHRYRPRLSLVRGSRRDSGSAGAADVEESTVSRALADSGWNLAAAARELGVSRSALYRFLKRHGIERPTV